MADDRSKPPPLERRVPGATRAGPASPSRPELPEALLRRMQAVVKAAHAQALQEEEARRAGAAAPDPDAHHEASASSPGRVPGTAGAPNGVPRPRLPTASHGRLPDQDAEFDTDPFLPRLTASGTISSPPVNQAGAQADHTAQQNHSAQQNHTAQQDDTAQKDDTAQQDGTSQQDGTVKPERAERELAAEAAWAERERAAQAEHERAAHTEREPAGPASGQAAAAQGAAGAGQDLAERSGQAQRTASPDRAEPDQTASPASRAGRPSLTVRRAPRRRRYRTIALAAGVAAALAAGPLALALSRPSPVTPNAAKVTRDQAAAWVARQVSRDAVVSCDVTTCLALKADGFPVGDLLVMGPKAKDLLSSQVIVSTAAIRTLFGSRLDTAYAPAVLASFGSGKTRIDIRVIAPDGAAAYLSALRADWQERKSAGGALAGTPRITLTAVARRQMTSGQVDARVLIVITSLAIIHPLDILAFGDSGPGASPGVPLRSVTLAEKGRAAIARSMLLSLRGQPGPYHAAHIETTRHGGQSVMVIDFAAPVPLGLINGPNP